MYCNRGKCSRDVDAIVVAAQQMIVAEVELLNR
jgi:hypothetical protein